MLPMACRPFIAPVTAALLTAAVTVASLEGVAGAASLCGTVLDSATQLPLPRAVCFLFDDQGQYTGLHAGTDAQGSYCIDNVAAGTYTLQVRHDDYGTATVTNILVEDVATGVDVGLDSSLLLRAWPNPSSNRLQIRWRAAGSSKTMLEVFDLAGRRVQSWRSGPADAPRELIWNLRDWKGRPVANGSYLVRLRSENSQLSRRIVLMR